MAVNIYDIAQKAGVSTATVSRVLNNSSHVREDTRRKILEIIEESGYVPNAFARGLGMKTMKTIGLLCPNASDPFLASALAELERAFRDQGYDCLLCCSGKKLADRMEGVEKLANRHVDGMVLMGSGFMEENDQDNDYIRRAAENVPVVLLNGALAGGNVYSVRCDDQQASYEATKYLLDTGCRRILYLYHSLNYSGQRKLLGYRQAIEEAGLAVEEKLMVRIGEEQESVQQVRDLLLRLDQQGVKFDAVYTSEDLLAVAAVKYAAAAGRRVPQELSILGYNNSDLCVICEPELTSVDNKLPAICAHVVATMMGVLEGRLMPQKTFFAGEIIRRASTK